MDLTHTGKDGQHYPHGFHRWNRAHQGAYKKGRMAHKAGIPLDHCPYGDYRKGDGRLTWSRSFQAAWLDGWRDARWIVKNKPEWIQPNT